MAFTAPLYFTLILNNGERRRVRPRYLLTKPASFSGQSFAATRACTDSTPTLPKWLLSVLTWWWWHAQCVHSACMDMVCSVLPWLHAGGRREVAKAPRGHAAAMGPLGCDGGRSFVAARANSPRGTEDRAQRAHKRAQGSDPARCSRIFPRTGLTCPPPVPPRRYRPQPTDVPWALARDGSRALDVARCRRPSRRRAW